MVTLATNGVVPVRGALPGDGSDCGCGEVTTELFVLCFDNKYEIGSHMHSCAHHEERACTAEVHSCCVCVMMGRQGCLPHLRGAHLEEHIGGLEICSAAHQSGEAGGQYPSLRKVQHSALQCSTVQHIAAQHSAARIVESSLQACLGG